VTFISGAKIAEKLHNVARKPSCLNAFSTGQGLVSLNSCGREHIIHRPPYIRTSITEAYVKRAKSLTHAMRQRLNCRRIWSKHVYCSSNRLLFITL